MKALDSVWLRKGFIFSCAETINVGCAETFIVGCAEAHDLSANRRCLDHEPFTSPRQIQLKR
jgi:hypothetical protein